VLPGCGADLDLLTRRVLIRIPAQHVVLGFFDRAGDFGPEILTLNPLAFTGCGRAAKFGIVDEQVERGSPNKADIGVVLYALSHGEHRPAEWMPGSIA
jgi:hypothetical protein